MAQPGNENASVGTPASTYGHSHPARHAGGAGVHPGHGSSGSGVPVPTGSSHPPSSSQQQAFHASGYEVGRSDGDISALSSQSFSAIPLDRGDALRLISASLGKEMGMVTEVFRLALENLGLRSKDKDEICSSHTRIVNALEELVKEAETAHLRASQLQHYIDLARDALGQQDALRTLRVGAGEMASKIHDLEAELTAARGKCKVLEDNETELRTLRSVFASADQTTGTSASFWQVNEFIAKVAACYMGTRGGCLGALYEESSTRDPTSFVELPCFKYTAGKAEYFHAERLAVAINLLSHSVITETLAVVSAHKRAFAASFFSSARSAHPTARTGTSTTGTRGAVTGAGTTSGASSSRGSGESGSGGGEFPSAMDASPEDVRRVLDSRVFQVAWRSLCEGSFRIVFDFAAIAASVVAAWYQSLVGVIFPLGAPLPPCVTQRLTEYGSELSSFVAWCEVANSKIKLAVPRVYREGVAGIDEYIPLRCAFAKDLFNPLSLDFEGKCEEQGVFPIGIFIMPRVVSYGEVYVSESEVPRERDHTYPKALCVPMPPPPPPSNVCEEGVTTTPSLLGGAGTT